jgi:hypothetical protein
VVVPLEELEELEALEELAAKATEAAATEKATVENFIVNIDNKCLCMVLIIISAYKLETK